MRREAASSGQKLQDPPLQPYTPDWASVTKHPYPAWFDKAKFGIYAHWGLYSVPAFGNEWYSRNMYVNGSAENKHAIKNYGPAFGYKDFAPLFTAPKFNATEWAALYSGGIDIRALITMGAGAAELALVRARPRLT